VPGAASFKRVLDGAPCPDARACRAPHGTLGPPRLGKLALGSHRSDGRGAARHADRAAVGWWGAASGWTLGRLTARRPAYWPNKWI